MEKVIKKTKGEGPEISTGAALVKIFRLFGSFKWGLAWCIFLLLIGAGLSVAKGLLIRHAIDANMGDKDWYGLLATVGVFLVSQALLFGVMYSQRMKLERIGQSIIADLKAKVFAKLLSLSLSSQIFTGLLNMTRKWCGPPIQAKDQRAGVLQRFSDLDYPDNIEKAFRAQSKRRLPRKRGAGPLPLGPGMAARLEALAALVATTATATGAFNKTNPISDNDRKAIRTASYFSMTFPRCIPKRETNR